MRRHSQATRAKIASSIRKHYEEHGLSEAQLASGRKNCSHDKKTSGRNGAISRLKKEADAENDLIAEGFEVLKLPVACDRLAIKDGHVYFVEFKRHESDELKAGQKRIRDLVPDMYLIRYYR